MRSLAEVLTGNLLLLLAVVLALVLLLIWLLYRMVRRNEARSGIEPADLESYGESPSEVITFTSQPLPGEVRRSFSRAEGSLRRILPGHSRRYGRPWILSTGPARAGKTTLLSRSHLALPYGSPIPDSPGISWWAFDRGIVLDVAGRSCLESDDCASDEAEWRGLLRRIRRARRRRPIDGLLLTLPASELAGGNDDGRLARAARRGAYLQRKLQEAQRELRMRLPVFLLVSHCDRLPGFGALVQTIPPEARQQMFGWSNPSSPRARYTPDLLDRAFDDLEAQLEAHQLEVLAAGRPPEEREAFIALPERLREMAEPLRIYANHLFLPRAGGGEAFLRGIYLCGGGSRDRTVATAGGVPGADSTPSEIVFVGDLLEQKVFPEAPLAEPSERAWRRARRRGALATLLLVAALAWAGMGLLSAPGRLAEKLAGDPSETASGLEAFLERAGRGEQPPGKPPFPQKSLEFLRGASTVESFRVWSPLLPASWFGDLQGKVNESVVGSFETVLFPTLLEAVDRRTRDLLDDKPPPFDPRTVSIEPVDDYPQLQDLDSFVRRLTALERLVERYQAFTAERAGRAGRTLRNLNALSLELLGEELRPRSREAERYLRRRLREIEATPFDYASRREAVSQAILERSKRLDRALFVHHRLLQDLESVSTALGSLGPLRWGTEANTETYRDLYRGLDRLSRNLQEPDLDWVMAETLDLGPRYEEIRRQVHESRFLGEKTGPATSEEMRRRALEMFGDLKRALLDFGTGYGGRLLETRENRLALTKPADDLKYSLAVILGEFFMQPQAGGELEARPPPGRILIWKKKPLEEALAVFRSYEGFPRELDKFLAEKKLEELPPPLRQSVPQIAAAAAGSNVIGLVANAISFQPVPAGLSAEQSVEAQVRNLQEVDQTHAEILAALEAMQRTGDGLRLAGILRDQQIGILRQLDALLDGAAPYRPRFGSWNGVGSPAAPALAASIDDLPAYLDAQREIVDRLAASYARPVLSAFGAAGSRRLRDASETARWWQGLVRDLEAYENKEAGNPLAALEEFVADRLPELDLFGCFDALPAVDAGQPKSPAPAAATSNRPRDGFFPDRLASLRRSLRTRCVELADEIGYDRYRTLSAEFNRRLKGKFPFAGPGAGSGADPADLKLLLGEEFGRTLTLVRNLPDARQRAASARSWLFAERTAEVQRFMRLMEGVRRFFAPYLPEDAELEVPTYDLAVEFRTLRSNEKGANQIIRWDLTIGEETVIDLLASLRASRTPPGAATEPPARWAYGLTSELSVAWALDSPYAPLAVESAGRARIEERRVALRYPDPWSLLRLIADLEAAPEELPDVGDEPRPEVLRLSVKTASADAPSPVESARLYLTLTLFAPEDDRPLKYPDFPRDAPVVPPRAGPAAPTS